MQQQQMQQQQLPQHQSPRQQQQLPQQQQNTDAQVTVAIKKLIKWYHKEAANVPELQQQALNCARLEITNNLEALSEINRKKEAPQYGMLKKHIIHIVMYSQISKM